MASGLITARNRYAQTSDILDLERNRSLRSLPPEIGNLSMLRKLNLNFVHAARGEPNPLSADFAPVFPD